MTDAEYYDSLYENMLADDTSEGIQWIQERANKVEPLIIGDSVLDLGCGLSLFQNRIKITYTGVDFSPFVIEWNRVRSRYKTSDFVLADITIIDDFGIYDTVMLLDVLEHIKDYQSVYHKAEACAKKRMIVTVPRDMLGKKHYHPRWGELELVDLMGEKIKPKMFGGDDGIRWWLAVKDIE